MTQVIKPLINSGDQISHLMEYVQVTVLCVRPGHAYRVVVTYPTNPTEIPELSQSFASEAVARVKAREVCHRFDGGRTVAEVLDILAEEQREAALARVEQELAANGRRASSAQRRAEERALTAEREALLPEAVRVAADERFADMRKALLAAWGAA